MVKQPGRCLPPPPEGEGGARGSQPDYLQKRPKHIHENVQGHVYQYIDDDDKRLTRNHVTLMRGEVAAKHRL